ncbi:MAG: RlmE family RNA methyltransferase [Candidatus Lokiarchaeota archaeon]|nr:RlmE family RNA methyltransferase [Candidatus Lokiarchaeota archaeon]
MPNSSEEHRKEAVYIKAKKKGYRARSAFKLLDIQKRYMIFKRVFYILDLGSAPGSWLQVAKQFGESNIEKYNDHYYHRDHYKIMGVDTKKLIPIEEVEMIKMDFTTPEFQVEINNYFNKEKLDLILCDASINKSGNKFSDQARQVKLCFKVLELTENLKVKGNFVIKVFQGADFENFYKRMKQVFTVVRSLKPKSSNKKSNEIYLIGLKKKY